MAMCVRRALGVVGGRLAVLEARRVVRPSVPFVVVSQRRWLAKKHKKEKKKDKKKVEVAAAVEDVQKEEDEPEEEVHHPEEEDVMSEEFLARWAAKFVSASTRLEAQLSRMRGASPTPELFEDARVEVYESIQPLSAVAQITVKSTTVVECRCFDPVTVPAVADALRKIDGLNLNPRDAGDGSLVIPFPRPSAEARAMIVKAAGKAAEQAHVKVKMMRNRAHDMVKKKAHDDASEDDKRRRNTQIDKLAEDTNKRLHELLDAKKKDILGD